MKLDFHPSVGGEVELAYRWYENLRPGLGDEFILEVGRVLSEIEANPARFGFADDRHRVGQLRRFPYAIYYRDLPVRPRILAVQHTSRSSAAWKSRN